jgi:putative flavoprotein involved in K+ transport
MPIDQHPLREKARKKANHYLTGRDGGRDIDLRRFALEGMILHGRLHEISAGEMHFRDDLAKNLDAADATYNNICATIDRHIEEQGIAAPEQAHYQPIWQPGEAVAKINLDEEGIAGVVWATGFRSDWSWVDLPMFDGAGYPTHQRGVTSVAGAYVLGLPWLYTWGSGRFVGVGRDAAFIAEHIEAQLALPARQLEEAV